MTVLLHAGNEYYWYDGETSDYRAWAIDEPNDLGGIEDCLEVYADSATWNDINCGAHQLLAYVCKAPKSKLTFQIFFF